jgi:hypothetical protein
VINCLASLRSSAIALSPMELENVQIALHPAAAA